jgi:hypothetical protein
MIACIREEYVTEDQSKIYLDQVAANQTYIRRYETSPRALSVAYQLAQMAASQPRQHEYLGSARRMFVATPATLHTKLFGQDAELSSLEDSRDAFQLYDVAVR